jgi:hypothetical protein
LDEVSIRKRAATKGDIVVEVKPGEEVVSVNVSWTVEKFVEEVKEVKKRPSLNGNGVNGKKPAPAKASSNGQIKASSAKGKAAPAKAAKSKPAKKSPTKSKKKK